MKLYEAYVYNANEFNSLDEAIDANSYGPDTENMTYGEAAFETLGELENYIAGVEAVNDLPGIQHFAIEVVKHFQLKVYRGSDYGYSAERYSKALKDGAVYDTSVIVTMDDLMDKELLNRYNKLVNRTEACINDGESNVQLILVHPFFSLKFHHLSDFL